MNENQPMTPFGKALSACYEGDAEATITIRRDDGTEAPLPAKYFFRSEPEFTIIEKEALALCHGRILDAGAGSGTHSLVLQSEGHHVTAIDISNEAVEVMKRRGIQDARVINIYDFDREKYNTLLMLGHGIGMTGTLEGLDRFLLSAGNWLVSGGQILVDSTDIRKTTEEHNLAYQQENRKANRYFGEIRFQMEFRGIAGPFLSWLHVDPETLASHASKTGWNTEIVTDTLHDDYLARLVKKGK